MDSDDEDASRRSLSSIESQPSSNEDSDEELREIFKRHSVSISEDKEESESESETDMDLAQKAERAQEFLRENKTNRFFQGHVLPGFMGKADNDALIKLRTRFLFEYKNFVKENQGNQEAIEDFVDDWKATEEEKTNARGTILTNPGNWKKKSVIKEYDFFKDTENPEDLVLAKKAIIRRYKENNEWKYRPNIRDYDTQVILSKSEIPCWLNWSHKSKHFGQKKWKTV
jgi:hypothetical protein